MTGDKAMVNVKVFNHIGQKSRSMSESKAFWYEPKGLVIRNLHVKYKRHTCHVSKAMSNVSFQIYMTKVTVKVTGQKFWCQLKSFITRNIHVTYEIPISKGSKVTAYVEVFRYEGQMSGSRPQGQNFW